MFSPVIMPRPTNTQDVLSSSSSSPSEARRQALRRADVGNTIRVLDSYPLSKYFDISQRLLDAFQKSVDARRLDEAYVYGLRFAAFGVESLPKHKEWRSNTGSYSKQKRRNSQQVEKVISMMEIIKQRMDAEELILQEKRRVHEDEMRRKEEEQRRQQRVIEETEYRQREERQRTLERDKNSNINVVKMNSTSKVLYPGINAKIGSSNYHLSWTRANKS